MIKKIINLVRIYKRKMKYKKISYSYNGIDLLIDYIFKSKKKGFYLDVGCQHPISNNNTYLLYKRGWNGMNIDSSGIVKTDFYFYEITPVEYYNTPYVRRRDKLVGTVYLEKER